MNVETNKKPKDIRPRIISIKPVLKGVNIAAQQSILWPCHAFQILIPQKKTGNLNVLEEVIFKLSAISTCDTDKLVEITCLEKDLVIFIQNRLAHMNLLNSRFEITEEGQDYYKDTYQKPVADNKYTAARVFVDILNGKLLPYIQEGAPEYCKIRSMESASIQVVIGSSGKERTVIAKLIKPDKNSHWNMNPTTSDIVKIIREYQRKYRHHVILNPELRQCPTFVPKSEALSVQNQPELVYFLCDMIVQEGNADLLVTDGIGLGFSQMFADYLMRQNLEWITEFKKRGVQDRIEIDGDTDKPHRVTYRYPEVTRRFLDSQNGKVLGINSLLREVSKAPETASEVKEYVNQKQQIATKLYEAIEWSLRYLVSDYPVDEWTQIFESQNYQTNNQILIAAAEKIGFKISYKSKHILQVKAGAIRQLSMGSVNLQPLLALAIIGAANKYKAHPLNKLATETPDSLGDISDLKNMRDRVMHGEIHDYKDDYKELNDIVGKCKEFIEHILPQIKPELHNGTTDAGGYSIETNQERLKAEIELETVLGTAFMYSVEPDIKELLVRSELMILNYSSDYAYVVVNNLCSSIQATISMIVKGLNAIDEQSDFMEIATSRMVRFGFYPDESSVPEAFTTVRQDLLRRAVLGRGGSLGADVLALFIRSSKSDLISLYLACPSFLQFVASLIALREHGNENKREFTHSEITELATEVFKTIKKLKEIF